jgi:hypothetical protein
MPGAHDRLRRAFPEELLFDIDELDLILFVSGLLFVAWRGDLRLEQIPVKE